MKILFVFLGITSAIVVGFPSLGQRISIEPQFFVSCNNNSLGFISFEKCRESIEPGQPGSLHFTDSERLLVDRLKTALGDIKVTVREESCESRKGTTLYGSYNDETKKLILCQGALANSRAYIDTLAHESWHVVQDCLNGMETNNSIALSEKNPSFFARIQGDIPERILDDVKKLYPEEKQMTELEARFMEKQPNEVWKALKACATRSR
ncbi:hypothetical protein V0288_18560 [Pannus brasiliensis CCIBt3594]|uniref:Uncharacterized protein n=1 Tax=Pannus brasiliensis CCIBt3594 TaxID=1427578 RepID=A0AAW9QUZ0_9CHRO